MSKNAVTATTETRLDSKTRVDSAHSPHGDELVDETSSDVLSAIAGQNASHTVQQMRGQALELASILREKQKSLDERESEVNARLAALENRLRTSRLKDHVGVSLEVDEPTPEVIETAGQSQELQSDQTETPDDDVKGPRAETVRCWKDSLEVDDDAANEFLGIDIEQPARQEDQTPVASDPEPTDAPDLFADVQEELERKRQILLERHQDLDKRQQTLEQTQDQVTVLHREALELRLATEEVWSELVDQFPSEELASTISNIRSKLADHYQFANEELTRRQEHLHELRLELNKHEQRLRHQRREMQLWADRQYDEIEAKAAQLHAREQELDRMEADFRNQLLRWRKQREQFRQEVEGLGVQPRT